VGAWKSHEDCPGPSDDQRHYEGGHMSFELPPRTWYTECPRCGGTATGIREIPRAKMGTTLRGLADPVDVRVLAHFLGACQHLWVVIVYEDERREKYAAWRSGSIDEGGQDVRRLLLRPRA
jgi:hypothetical protein